MSETPPPGSSIGSLIASRRRRLSGAEPGRSRGDGEGTDLLVALRRTGETVFEGHAADPLDPARRLIVELLLNGEPAAIARAELFDPDLYERHIGDGCHGFVFHIDAAVLPQLASVAARIANTAIAVGPAIDVAAAAPLSPGSLRFGRAEWTGGLHIAGWVRRETGPFAPTVEAYVDGVLAATARADAWRSVAEGSVQTAEPGFELTLPKSLADGRAHAVELLSGGRPLAGSPVTLIAFPDGLKEFLDGHAEADCERPRGRFFDAAFPDSVPFDALDAVETRFPLSVATRKSDRPVALAIIGEAGADATLASPALADHDAWVGAILPSAVRTGGGTGRFDAQDFLKFLGGEAEDCAVVVLVPAGTDVRAFALDRLAAALDNDPSADIAYGDVLLARADGGLAPLALPAFDYERTLEQGIGGFGFAMRREAAIAAVRRGLCDLNRLFLAPLDQSGPTRAAHLHVPGFAFALPAIEANAAGEALAVSVAAHLAARGLAADLVLRPAATLPSLRVKRRACDRSVTLVIDAAPDPAAIEATLSAFEASLRKTGAAIVVSLPVACGEIADRLRLAGVTVADSIAPQPRFARLGAAAALAKTDLVCFLDPRLRAPLPDWLAEMLARAGEADVGAVGATIVRACGLVAEAGIVLQPSGAPVQAFADRRLGDPGYGDGLAVARQASAVGEACLLTRRADFIALGGFDPVLFPKDYGAIDYCLKLQALGRRVVVTPDAVLVYEKGPLFGDDGLLPGAERLRERARRVLLSRWPTIHARDPFYSPLLNRSDTSHAALAWPPGDPAPRRAAVPPARDVPPGW